MRPPAVDHPGPTTPWLFYWAGRLWFWLFGWEVEGESPKTAPKGVLIAAPHTSNWDLAHMLAASFVFRVRLSWLGKHTLFKPPWGWLMRALGGVAIDRRSPQGAVQSVADLLKAQDQLYIAVPPSGTRSKRDHWKSGFYWMAHTAEVPIICGYLDYSRKRAGLGFILRTTGDVHSDMEKLRAFYAGKRGKFPENESAMVLQEEGGAAAKA